MKAVIEDYIKLKRSKSTKELALICLKKFFEWKYATKFEKTEDIEPLAKNILSNINSKISWIISFGSEISKNTSLIQYHLTQGLLLISLSIMTSTSPNLNIQKYKIPCLGL